MCMIDFYHYFLFLNFYLSIQEVENFQYHTFQIDYVHYNITTSTLLFDITKNFVTFLDLIHVSNGKEWWREECRHRIKCMVVQSKSWSMGQESINKYEMKIKQRNWKLVILTNVWSQFNCVADAILVRLWRAFKWSFYSILFITV